MTDSAHRWRCTSIKWTAMFCFHGLIQPFPHESWLLLFLLLNAILDARQIYVIHIHHIALGHVSRGSFADQIRPQSLLDSLFLPYLLQFEIQLVNLIILFYLQLNLLSLDSFTISSPCTYNDLTWMLGLDDLWLLRLPSMFFCTILIMLMTVCLSN